jgi:DNA-binding transcriptional LysR family regulator
MIDRLVATGRFLTVLPRFILKLPGRHLSLKALPVDLPNARGTVSIVTLKGRTLSPLAGLFIKTVRAVTGPLAKR